MSPALAFKACDAGVGRVWLRGGWPGSRSPGIPSLKSSICKRVRSGRRTVG